MSYSLISLDTTTLPDAMLDMAKAHMRVDFPEDDETITEYVAWAIGYLENFLSIQIFAGEATFTPEGGTAKVQCPVQPVSQDFSAADADGDVTADYLMQSAGFTAPVWLSRVDGEVIPAGVTFTLTAGYDDPAAMHPSLRGNILRIAATMYENRESISAMSLEQIPSWLSDMLGGLWIPRA